MNIIALAFFILPQYISNYRKNFFWYPRGKFGFGALPWNRKMIDSTIDDESITVMENFENIQIPTLIVSVPCSV